MSVTHTHPQSDGIKSSRTRQIGWGLLFVTSVAGVVMSVVTGIERRDYTECNAEQVTILIKYQQETREAAALERDATRKVREAQLAGDEAGEHAAIVEYLKVNDVAEAKRAAAPLPQLPEVACGKG